MKTHDTDLVSLLFGLAFVITAAGVLAYELSDADIDPAWVAAGSLIFLGVVAMVSTLLRRPSAPDAPDTPSALRPPERTDASDEVVDDIAER